jgi:protein O-GlcNAc transferase
MPFYLAYQGGADRDLQASYGEIVGRIANAALAPDYTPPPAPAGRIRILFATAFGHVHSVMKLYVSWIEKLDRSRFEIAFFHLGRVEDAMTQRLREAADLFEFGPRPAAEWIEAAARYRPHVIVYLEIGMDAATLALTALRLAPVQAVAWGHPQTSGLSTIDYFLTSDLMEPENGQANYTETLVRLPNLSVSYTPPPSAPLTLDRARLGTSAERPLYLCCQSLFKYLPAYDFIYPQIAAAAPGALFLFIGRNGDPARRRLDARLMRAFAASGLDYREHVRFCEPLPFSQFAGLLRMGDVFLDSIGWSGGNTTLEAVEVGLPIVTLPTGHMRGRHTAAILAMLDMPEGVADSAEDYIARAAALADPARRLAFVEKLSARKARVFGDETPIRALEEFLSGAVARAYADAAFSFAPQVSGIDASEQAAAM